VFPILPLEDASPEDVSVILVQDGALPPATDAGCTQWTTYCVELIDDLESNTAFLPPISGRDGPWYTYNDATPGGTQWPVPWPASTFTASSTMPAFANPVTGANSAYSAGTYGAGFTNWGAGMGFLFVNSTSQGTPRPYDASAYQGIVLWARANGMSTFRVTLSDANTSSQVGACGSPSECDAFGATLPLSPSWLPKLLDFAMLTQESWGKHYPALDPHTLVNMNFQVPAGQKFDFEVDDLYFILK
jgi:hypothetical protein